MSEPGTEKIPESIGEEKPAFSIVIPTWNNLPYLKLCLRSIEQHSHYKHQIIVHINEGSDGTKAWLEQQNKFDTSFSSENIGVCRALNRARELVKTDYLLYMNDDMYVCPGWDRPLVEAIQNARSNLFFYSATMMQQGSFRDNSVLANCDYGNTLETFDEEKFLAEWQNPEHQDWSGATWPPNVVHIDMWDEVGGYSEEFSPGMYSDPDFSMKLWQAGVRDFRGISQTRVYHFARISTGRVKKNDGAKQFLLKWGMTSSTFGRHYLRRGKRFKGLLGDPDMTLRYLWDRSRSRFRWICYKFFGKN